MNIEEKITDVLKQIVKDIFQLEPEEGLVMIEIPKENTLSGVIFYWRPWRDSNSRPSA